MRRREAPWRHSADGRESLQLVQRPRDLSPDGVNVLVEGLEGEDLELGLLVREKGQEAGGRGPRGHLGKLYEQMRDGWIRAVASSGGRRWRDKRVKFGLRGLSRTGRWDSR
jgi:hypothetical protein